MTTGGGATADVEEEEEEEVVAAMVEEVVVFFDLEAASPIVFVARTRPAMGVTRRAAERMMVRCMNYVFCGRSLSDVCDVRWGKWDRYQSWVPGAWPGPVLVLLPVLYWYLRFEIPGTVL